MIRSFPPSPALAPYVINLLAYDIAPTAAHPWVEWVVYPDTASVACFLFGDAVQAAHAGHAFANKRSGISGFQTGRFDVQGSGRQAGVIVRLSACGARCLYPCDATSLVDLRLDYRELVGNTRIESLEDQLHALSSAEARVRCVEDFLRGQLQPLRLDAVAQATAATIRRCGGRVPLQMLAGEVHLSASALVRRFTRAVGVGPKKYGRVVRLQSALRHYGLTGSWADTAAETGFADQSHLIRECHALLGESPRDFWRGRDSESRRRLIRPDAT